MTLHKDLQSMFLFICTLFILSLLKHTAGARTEPKNFPIPAVFVFGDSTVDPGNNNYIRTLFKSNFPPYGRDLPNHNPTGRFTNGRLVTDFIASYSGVKDFVPPYLDPNLTIHEMMTGVSFASAGSGLDPLTPRILGVIPIPRQVEYFREYKTRLALVIGEEKTADLVRKSAYILSAGTNDFVLNYFSGLTCQKKRFTVSAYQQFLMQNLQMFIQNISDEGAQKIGIVGLPPMGCLPIAITMYSHGAQGGRQCIESFSSTARVYNQILQDKLSPMINGTPVVAYADIYTPLMAAIQDPKFGFEEVKRGCCGTGLLETSFMCNHKTHLCPNVSKYVFWDSIHPTDRAYNIIFTSLIPLIEFFLKL